MRDTVVINKNGGCQIDHKIRKAFNIEPGDLVEIDVIRIAKKHDEEILIEDSKSDNQKKKRK